MARAVLALLCLCKSAVQRQLKHTHASRVERLCFAHRHASMLLCGAVPSATDSRCVHMQYDVSHIAGAYWVGEEGEVPELQQLIAEFQAQHAARTKIVACYCSVGYRYPRGRGGAGLFLYVQFDHTVLPPRSP